MLSLLAYCKRNNWAGHDPYDALNSRLFNATPFRDSKLCRLVMTQGLKRLPLNIRPLLLIGREQNPKALALFLAAGLRLSRLGIPGTETIAGEMITRLEALRSRGTSYWCWGYSFPWQTRTVLVPRGAPNVVCTVFVADALLDAYEASREARLLDMPDSACRYMLKELYWTDADGTASFSYPLPCIRTKVHNANLLGAALFCRLYRHTGDDKYLEPAMTLVRYSVARQKQSGAWDYGEHATQGWADNFHTGYNLCALRSIARNIGTGEFDAAIHRGFEFYRANFFKENGTPKYFHDRTYPIDAHCVAQSIITLLELRDLAAGSIDMAEKVYNWAMENLWDSEGYFYYQVQPVYKNRISYMRWTQAWMLLALAKLLEQLINVSNQ